MAYSEQLAQRIRDALAGNRAISEKKMFGGIAFLRHGFMFVGKSNHADSLARQHVRPMDFTGKPMQGYVFIDAAGVRTEAQIRFWLARCLQFVSTLPPQRSR